MNTRRFSSVLLIWAVLLAVPSVVRAQIEIGAQSESIISLGEQPETSVKLKNGQYRSGKFIYASRYYMVIEPKQAVRADAMKMYGGLAVKWDLIDTFRITSLDVEITPSGTTGEAIFNALGGLPGASGSSKEPTTAYKEERKEERKKPKAPKDDEPKVVAAEPMETVRPMNVAKPEGTPDETPVPGTAAIPAVPATTPPGPDAVPAIPPMPVETPIPVATAEAVFVCSSCGKDVRESQAKLGKCPHCGVAFGNVAAATGAPAPAPAGPRVLELPQMDPSVQQQQTGFDFMNMSLGGKIGVFAGIIGVLFVVMRMM